MTNKKSPFPLRLLCWSKVTENFTHLEDQIAELPLELINEYYERIISTYRGYRFVMAKISGEIKSLPSRIFLNAITTKLPIHLNYQFDLPIDQLVKTYSHVFKNLRCLKIEYDVDIQQKHLEMLIIQIPNIENLSLGSPNCTDSVLFNISTCCFKLRHLDLRGCENVSDDGVVHLCSNSEILSLNLRSTSVTNQGHITVLKKLPHLKSFYFDPDIQLFRVLEEDLTSWKANSLEIFVNSYFKLTENSIRVASVLFPNLRSFGIDSQNVNELVNFPRLAKLRVYFNNEVIPIIIGKHLTCLTLLGFTNLDISIILNDCCVLKYLCLKVITHSEILSRDINLKNLKSLTIAQSNIKKCCFFPILASSLNLRILKFITTEMITDELIVELMKNYYLCNLRVFELHFCREVTTKSMLTLLDGLNSLKRLLINSCRFVSDEVLCDHIYSYNIDVIYNNSYNLCNWFD